MTRFYAVALIFQRRYIDFQFIEAENKDQAVVVARQHILPEFKYQIGAVVFGKTYSEAEYWQHPALPDLYYLHDHTNAFQTIGEDGCNLIHDFVIKYFKE